MQSRVDLPPQKLGLDVLIERDTGNIVTLEINGENSGYQGLVDLGENSALKISKVLAREIHGKKVLAHPFFVGLMPEEFYLPYLRILSDHGAAITFTPYFHNGYSHPPVTRQDLEAICHLNIDDYDAILSLGGDLGCFTSSENIERKMINTPAVEKIMRNKLLQYELLKDIPGFSMPETSITPVGFAEKILEQKIQQYGKVVIKPVDAAQGEGIMVVDAAEFEQYKSFIFDCLEQYCTDLRPSGYRGPPNTTEIQAYLREHEMEIDFLKITPPSDAIIIQPYIPSRPVVEQNTTEEHFARARLIWFDGYIDGYWGLSQEPIHQGNDLFNPIVNYSKTQKAQRFTPEEASMFAAYATDVVPKILASASHFVGRTSQLTALFEQKYTEAIRGTT